MRNGLHITTNRGGRGVGGLSRMVNEIEQETMTVHGVDLEIGFLLDATSGSSDPENIQKALWSEYGTATQPPRPFLSAAFDRHWNEWVSTYIKSIRGGTALNVKRQRTALKKMALKAQHDVGQTAFTWTSSANAESTVAKKKHSQPLVGPYTDRGGETPRHMYEDVQYNLTRRGKRF